MKKLLAIVLVCATGCAQVGGGIRNDDTANPEPRCDEETTRAVVLFTVAIGILVVATSMARSAAKDLSRLPR